uniref:Odorant-binding protein OBP39 n=1 Tax=Lobesia botrana TaxID=209534 RepID=A0A345BER2_9NEOP|nr:odorant-binding protein OBP39 [Lobesia botrana]
MVPKDILALFVFVIPQIYAGDEDDITSCLELFKPEEIEQNCCEPMKMLHKEDFESCKTADGEWECENAKCLLGKAGILSGDSLDEKKTTEMLDKTKEKHPDTNAMADRVKSECLGGKYEDYPPKESCPLIRFQICSYLNALVECDKWKDSDQCKKLSSHAKTCKSVLDNLKE